MSTHAANMSFNKKEYVIFGVVLIIAIIASLAGLFGFNNEENNVALSAVQSQAADAPRIDFVDEHNTYYISDGDTVWKEQLVKDNGQWKATNIQKIGDLNWQKKTEIYN